MSQRFTITLIEDDGDYFLESKQLGVFVTHENLKEVFKLFEEQLEHFHFYYIRTPDKKLNENTLKQKKIYYELFSDNNVL